MSYNEEISKSYLLKLEKQLDNNEDITHIIERLLGSAIFYDNCVNIAKLNLLIREYRIKTNRDRILEQIYNTSCGERYRLFNTPVFRGAISFFQFKEMNHKYRTEYFDNYRHVFKYHNDNGF